MIRRGALYIRGSKDRKLFYLPASMAAHSASRSSKGACGYFLRRKNGMMHSTISPRQLANENSVISTPNVAPVEVMTIATISTPTMMLLNEAKT